MHIVTKEYFDEAYALLESSFDKSELRDYHLMKEYFEKNRFHMYEVSEKETIKGVIICWEFDSFVFLENLAVKYEYRRKGIGSKILEEVKHQYSNKTIILEVEKPINDVCIKRIKFYKRNGFHLSDYYYMQPPLNEKINEIPLYLMSYPHSISEDDFNAYKKILFKNAY